MLVGLKTSWALSKVTEHAVVSLKRTAWEVTFWNRKSVRPNRPIDSGAGRVMVCSGCDLVLLVS